MSSTITCPNCNSEIEITEVMSAQLAAQVRAELEAELAPRKKALDAQAAQLKEQQAGLEQARRSLDE